MKPSKRRDKEVQKELAVNPNTEILDLSTGSLIYMPPSGKPERRVYLAY